MEDALVAAQREGVSLRQERIDELFRGIDLLGRIANVPAPELASWEAQHRAEMDAFLCTLAKPASVNSGKVEAPGSDVASRPAQHNLGGTVPPSPSEPPSPPAAERGVTAAKGGDARALRVSAENLNRLLGLAGESVVASRWLDGFASQMLRFKRLQNELTTSLKSFSESLAGIDLSERGQAQLSEVQSKAAACRETFATRLEELESFDRRFINLSQRLYHEVLDCRMRPFADGVQGFPRMVRDAARALGKEVKLEILRETTEVDREILERVESPLGHLLRNAIDHGIESPEERRRAGKTGEGKVRLEARHSAGMLLIDVADDGRGIDLEALRSAVVRKGLTTVEIAEKLADAELFEFLFLPGFTMKESVTEISGRGVGLDVVQTMVKQVGGSIRTSSSSGQGTHFQLQLPLTLSVSRTLLVEIAGEPYAFPLGRITAAVKVPREKIESIEGREHFTFGDQQIGLVTAHQALGLEESRLADAELSVIVLGDKTTRFGLVIDRFLGERDLVVRALDPRLGKSKRHQRRRSDAGPDANADH